MSVKGKSLRTLTKLIKASSGLNNIRLAVRASNFPSEKWLSLGFNQNLEIGDHLIPEHCGKITLFNSNGREIIRKDLPKQQQSRTIYATWKDWHGYEHSGFQNRNYEMYPREYVLAPAEFLYVFEVGGEKYVTSSETKVSDEIRTLHIATLMLECFGEFEIIDVATSSVSETKLRRLHWDILPPGEYPWVRAAPLITKATEKLSEPDQKVIEARMKHLAGYTPDFLATGRGGFTGYLVYGFSSRNIFILESIHLDNATYAFEDNWEEFSMLTKNEIINGAVAHERVIHDRKWKRNILGIMTK